MRRLRVSEFNGFASRLPRAAWDRVMDECNLLNELGADTGPQGDVVQDCVLVRELRAAGLPVPEGWEVMNDD